MATLGSPSPVRLTAIQPAGQPSTPTHAEWLMGSSGRGDGAHGDGRHGLHQAFRVGLRHQFVAAASRRQRDHLEYRRRDFFQCLDRPQAFQQQRQKQAGEQVAAAIARSRHQPVLGKGRSRGFDQQIADIAAHEAGRRGHHHHRRRRACALRKPPLPRRQVRAGWSARRARGCSASRCRPAARADRGLHRAVSGFTYSPPASPITGSHK